MVYGTAALRKRFVNVKLHIGSESIERVPIFKYLGVNFDEGLNWDEHVKYIHSKACSRF